MMMNGMSKKAAAKAVAQEKANRTLHVKGGCWYDGTYFFSYPNPKDLRSFDAVVNRAVCVLALDGR